MHAWLRTTIFLHHIEKITTNKIHAIGMSKLFPDSLIIAYKRAMNLKDLLVKSRFQSGPPSHETEYNDDTLLNDLIAEL